jgi:cyanophycinase-like exopeptidase
MEHNISAVALIPTVVVNIAVDTQFLIGQNSGQYAGAGIYMMDNMVTQGSSFSGTSKMELITMANNSAILAFNVQPIDTLQGLGDTVSIIGFQVSSTPNLFVGGKPVQQTSGDYQWLAQVSGKSGQRMTYQVMIQVNSGGIQPQIRNFWWDPFIQIK